jgi:alcohol dehydrogenase class IV
MDEFTISPVPELIFGAGTFRKLSVIISQKKYENIVVITGGNSFTSTDFWFDLTEFLKISGVIYYHFRSTGETNPNKVDEISRDLNNKDIDAVIAIGGGTVMDTGKAVSAMLCMSGSIVDYLEEIGTKKPTGIRKPLICIPTTSGTGSEATKNAVITKTGRSGYKKSLRHRAYIPDTVIIDPELIISCPVSLTLATGLDAVTQLLESYVSTKSTPFTETLALEGLKLAGESLPELVRNSDSIDARSKMAYAAYLSGISLANAGLGVIHGAASVLGAIRPIPHGVVCGTLLGSATKIIISKLIEENNQQFLKKYAEAGISLSGIYLNNSEEACYNLIKLLNSWINKYEIPRLSEYGFTDEELVECSKITGIKNTPCILDTSTIYDIYSSRL